MSEGRMRVCKKCGLVKPLEDFGTLNKGREWRRNECSACVRQRKRRGADDSKRLVRRYSHEWTEGRYTDIRLNHYFTLQRAAILHYGGYKCACCEITEPMFLTIDHINGGGCRHRKEMAPFNGGQLYKWLKDNNYPPGFRVLCMNCNQGTWRNGGICPHKIGLAGDTQEGPQFEG
jgi:hypothetical protein